MSNKLETFKFWCKRNNCLKQHSNLIAIEQGYNIEKAAKVFFGKETEVFVYNTYLQNNSEFLIFKIIWNSITVIIKEDFYCWTLSINSPINISIPEILKEKEIVDFEDGFENKDIYPEYCDSNKRKFTLKINSEIANISTIFGLIVSSHLFAKERIEYKIATESNSKCEYYQKIVEKNIEEYQKYLISLAEKLCKNKNQCFLDIKDKFYVVNGEERYFLNKYSEINIRYRINSCDICTKEPNLTISVIDESRPLGSYERYKTFYLSDYKDLKDIGIILEEYCKKLY